MTVESTPVVIKGGSGVSFDDMDAITDNSAPVSGKEQTAIDKELEVKPTDTPVVPEVIKDEEKKEEVEKKEEEKPSGKKVKGKIGESEIELDLETLVPVVIDGKEEMIPLSEIRNGFSGTKAISKRFSEFDKEKKTFVKEKQEIETKLGRTKEFFQTLDQKLESENPYEALEFLIEKGGKSSYDFKYNKLLPAMMDEVTQLLQMDEVSREAYLAKKENEYLKKGRESEEAKTKEEASRMELIAKVDALREAKGISEDEYVKAHQELLEMGHKNFKPENVIDYVENFRAITKSIELVKSIDPSKAANEDVIKSVAEAIKAPGITEEDIVNELRAYWGLPKAEAKEIGKKVEDSRPQAKKTVRGYESFDDYEMN